MIVVFFVAAIFMVVLVRRFSASFAPFFHLIIVFVSSVNASISSIILDSH